MQTNQVKNLTEKCYLSTKMIFYLVAHRNVVLLARMQYMCIVYMNGKYGIYIFHTKLKFISQKLFNNFFVFILIHRQASWYSYSSET